MTLEEVIEHFGSRYSACKALGIATQNFTHWQNKGYIPIKQQFMLESLTGGKLKASTAEEYLADNTGNENLDDCFAEEMTEVLDLDMERQTLSSSLIANDIYIRPNLKHAKFNQCDFANVIFAYPRLRGCTFSECNFNSVRFSKPTDGLLPKFHNCTLTNVEFVGVEMEDLEFSGCDLKDVRAG